MRRVVIAGLGDSGVLTAIKLARHADVVGISGKPGLVSGQELGWRLSRPRDWARHNWIPFESFRGLDRVQTVHGTLTGVDLAARKVFVERADGSTQSEPYDALVIATGVTNGFWRQASLQGPPSRRGSACGTRAFGSRTIGNRDRRRRGRGEQRRQCGQNVAGQASRSLLPRASVGRAPPARVWERVRRKLAEFGV